MRAVKKVVVKVTVLVDDMLSDSDMSRYPLSVIGHEIEEGDWLGMSEVVSIEDVPPEKVVEECLAVGNDGTFFNYMDDDI